jgi:hypothetical protein
MFSISAGNVRFRALGVIRYAKILGQFLAGSSRHRRFRVSNFAQTPSSHASKKAISQSPQCGSIRPFDKGSDISV